MLLIVCGVFFVSKKANTIIGDMAQELMRATTYAEAGTGNENIINKVDSKTKQPITEATFQLDQIEERTEPENVIGALTDNSNTYYEVDKNNEITDVLGELTDNGTYYFIKNEDNGLIARYFKSAFYSGNSHSFNKVTLKDNVNDIQRNTCDNRARKRYGQIHL